MLASSPSVTLSLSKGGLSAWSYFDKLSMTQGRVRVGVSIPNAP